MSAKPNNSEAKKWLNYFLISIPMAFILMKIIDYKCEVIFWIYLAIMGISAIITRWFGHSNEKSKFVRMVEHICFVCSITLFLWYFAFTFLSN